MVFAKDGSDSSDKKKATRTLRMNIARSLQNAPDRSKTTFLVLVSVMLPQSNGNVVTPSLQVATSRPTFVEPEAACVKAFQRQCHSTLDGMRRSTTTLFIRPP